MKKTPGLTQRAPLSNLQDKQPLLVESLNPTLNVFRDPSDAGPRNCMTQRCSRNRTSGHLFPNLLHLPNPTLARCNSRETRKNPKKTDFRTDVSPPFPKTDFEPSRASESPRSLSPSGFPVTISSSFHSLFRVLFTFPSQYFCAIGLTVIFSFGWDQPPVLGLQSQTTRLEETFTPVLDPSLQGYHLLGRTVPSDFRTAIVEPL